MSLLAYSAQDLARPPRLLPYVIININEPHLQIRNARGALLWLVAVGNIVTIGWLGSLFFPAMYRLLGDPETWKTFPSTDFLVGGAIGLFFGYICYVLVRLGHELIRLLRYLIGGRRIG